MYRSSALLFRTVQGVALETFRFIVDIPAENLQSTQPLNAVQGG
jgi:hypothetical protein